jgi:ABC-type phosphate/phosphonate transport system substrate-binding protein
MTVMLAVPQAASLADQGEQAKPAYRLGIFPYLPALTIDRLYSPVAESFSLALDRLVKLRTKTTFENFAEAIEGQSYDILFVHPFFLVNAVDQYGYLPLARLEQPLSAVLMVTDDSPVADIDGLIGETIGLPPKLAAVSDLIKAALVEAGHRPGLDVGIRHYRNKASCLQAVTTGAVAACGVPAFVLDQIEAFRKPALRAVFEAPPVSHFAFAVHSRVPEDERKRLQDLILSWSGDSGRAVLAALGLDKGFVPVQPDDYASVRAQKARLQTLAQR